MLINRYRHNSLHVYLTTIIILIKELYPVKRKPLMKSEVKKSVAVGGLKPPACDTFLTGFTYT